MKEYLEQRIEDLKEKYKKCEERYAAATTNAQASHYYARLYALEMSIKELELVLSNIK